MNKLTAMREELATLAAAPDDAPLGPPGRFYTDADWFAHERTGLLRQGWHCVGRADELPEIGDYKALQLLDEPLLVVRTEDGIVAHANLCRHRGMPLAEGEGNAKRFLCPYHAWIYGIDGALLRAPRMENASFDASTCRLAGFACEERLGFVFVSLQAEPPAIDQALSGLDDLIGPYDPCAYRLVHSATEHWGTNWKCLFENFMEGYHLSVVHPQTLHHYTPTGLSRKGPTGPGFTSYFANYPDGIPSRGRGAPGLTEEQRQRSVLYGVYPGHVVSISAAMLVALNIRPVDADSVEVRWTASVYGDDLDDETIADRVQNWHNVNAEDRAKLELMQAALGSVHATGGPLAGADYEGTVRDLLLWLAKADAA
ncbi:MAG: aromatic ring-hydroxylating dioxygenase subunit alpha [Pseudomonadota bacterium]